MGSPVVFFPIVRVKWDEGTGSLLLKDMAQTLFSRTEVAAEGVIPDSPNVRHLTTLKCFLIIWCCELEKLLEHTIVHNLLFQQSLTL